MLELSRSGWPTQVFALSIPTTNLGALPFPAFGKGGVHKGQPCSCFCF